MSQSPSSHLPFFFSPYKKCEEEEDEEMILSFIFAMGGEHSTKSMFGGNRRRGRGSAGLLLEEGWGWLAVACHCSKN